MASIKLQQKSFETKSTSAVATTEQVQSFIDDTYTSNIAKFGALVAQAMGGEFKTFKDDDGTVRTYITTETLNNLIKELSE